MEKAIKIILGSCKIVNVSSHYHTLDHQVTNTHASISQSRLFFSLKTLHFVNIEFSLLLDIKS